MKENRKKNREKKWKEKKRESWDQEQGRRVHDTGGESWSGCGANVTMYVLTKTKRHRCSAGGVIQGLKSCSWESIKISGHITSFKKALSMQVLTRGHAMQVLKRKRKQKGLQMSTRGHWCKHCSLKGVRWRSTKATFKAQILGRIRVQVTRKNMLRIFLNRVILYRLHRANTT